MTLVADPRSNSIIIRSDNSGRVARVRQLIEQLDTPGRAGGNIFIIYLKNAEAARVAQTLRSLLSGGGDVAPQGAGSLAPAAGGGVAGAVANVMSGAAPLSGGGAGGGSAGFASGGVSIQADSANNALIIQAPEPVYNNLRAIIEKLDIRRAQVYVEALIVEVSADKAAQFGIQWQALTGVGKSGVQGIGGTNFGARGSGNNIIDTSAAPRQRRAGAEPRHHQRHGDAAGTRPDPQSRVPRPRAARPTPTRTSCRRPAMLTLDNEEAKIVVGQNVPFITGQYAQTGTASSVTPFQTIERKDVGLTLRVKPQITEGGSVRLVIYQEVSRVDSTSNPAGIITNKRSLESSVTIDDGQIVVLGGLIQDAFDRRHGQGAAGRRPAAARRAVPLRQPAAGQDQPDGLPQADRRPRRAQRRRADAGPLRLPAGRAAAHGPAAAPVLERHDAAGAAAAVVAVVGAPHSADAEAGDDRAAAGTVRPASGNAAGQAAGLTRRGNRRTGNAMPADPVAPRSAAPSADARCRMRSRARMACWRSPRKRARSSC